jgi:hypothetical protein
MRKIISIFAVLALVLAISAPAYAQSSVQGYNEEAGALQDAVQNTANQPSAVDDSGGSLPFTGLDLALIAAAGGLLAVGGLGMRRLTRAPGSPA